MADTQDKIITPFTDIPFLPLPQNDAYTRNGQQYFSAETLNIGFGEKVFRSDNQGIWLGASDFPSAPFSVDMLGKVTALNIQTFQAVVATANGDYTTVAAALADGKTRIFVRNGTYSNEPKWNISSANTVIVGESYGGVVFSFASGASNINIYLTAANASFQNLYLKAYHTSSQALFYFESTCSNPLIQSCILENKNGWVFYGNGGTPYGSIQNCYIDAGTLDSAANWFAFYNLDYFTVNNVIINAGTQGGDLVIADSCDFSQFQNVRFFHTATNTNSINGCTNSLFLGCFFFGAIFAFTAEMSNCTIISDGNTSTSIFVTLLGAFTRFNNNRIVAAVGANILDISAANIQCNSNFISGGQQVRIRVPSSFIEGVSFVGNQWVSAFTLSAINFNILSSAHHAIVTNNVIRNNSGSFTPTVTDGGTGDTVANNQLING